MSQGLYGDDTHSLQITLDPASRLPIYQQIIDSTKQLIASGLLLPGHQLPPVRRLAANLGISQGTVLRAYMDLERDGIVTSRRGGGTIISAKGTDPAIESARRHRLSSLVSNHILRALSLGYSPDEIDFAFSLHLARWRRDQHIPESTPIPAPGGANIIRIAGSNDMALDLLVRQLQSRHPGTGVEMTHAGSLGGLIALQEGRAHLAGIHLLDGETGRYNYPYVKHILPGRKLAIVHLAGRAQGLMVAPGNPSDIRGFEDLSAPGVRFVNRQSGSGTRVLLDLELSQRGISPDSITGYNREVDTHLAVAASIARGEADAGLGLQAAAATHGIDFIPLLWERYDLVVPLENYQSRMLAPLLEVLQGEAFKRIVDAAGGYDTSETGSVELIST